MASPNRTKESAALVEAFGLVVAELRKARGFTQAELAGKVDIDTSTIAKIETGVHMPRIEQWLEMARVLRTTAHAMLEAAAARAHLEDAPALVSLDRDQSALQTAFNACNVEGKRLVLDYARATAKVFKPRVR